MRNPDKMCWRAKIKINSSEGKTKPRAPVEDSSI
jgi:hypothetical protein